MLFKLTCCNIYWLDEGSMLSMQDRTLFLFRIPSYGEFNAFHQQFSAREACDRLEVKTVERENNIRDLTNCQMHQLVINDIEPTNAILISTKERYRSYANWAIRNGHKIKVRLSKAKLPTVSLREQLVMVIRRFHPWKEDLDKFILKIEETGILKTWGTKPLLVDVEENPNLDNFKNSYDNALELEAIFPFMVFLSVGMAFSVLIFLCEHTFSQIKTAFKHKIYISRNISDWNINYSIGLILCIIPLCFLTHYYFKEEAKFPAIIGKFSY